MTEEDTITSSAGLSLEYNKDNACVDVYWSDNLDVDEPELAFVTAVPYSYEPDEAELMQLASELMDATAAYAGAMLEMLDEEEKNPAVNIEEDEEQHTTHNHVTRDVKSDGSCPACVRIHEWWSK